GGDPTTGYPRDSFTFTSMYNLSEGFLKGVGLGVNASVNANTVLYFYNDAAAGNIRKKMVAPDRTLVNLIASYEHKLTRKIGWKTQLNLINVFNRRDRFLYPNVTTGIIDN